MTATIKEHQLGAQGERMKLDRLCAAQQYASTTLLTLLVDCDSEDDTGREFPEDFGDVFTVKGREEPRSYRMNGTVIVRKLIYIPNIMF